MQYSTRFLYHHLVWSYQMSVVVLSPLSCWTKLNVVKQWKNNVVYSLQLSCLLSPLYDLGLSFRYVIFKDVFYLFSCSPRAVLPFMYIGERAAFTFLCRNYTCVILFVCFFCYEIMSHYISRWSFRTGQPYFVFIIFFHTTCISIIT